MSGFMAVRTTEGQIPRDVVDDLLASAAHRGNARLFLDADVALAAFDGRRGSGLAIAEDLVVALDARIDNARELDPQLDGRPAGDAERMLMAWRRWGPRALERVLGDFAGVVWDRRSRTLTVVRDPMAGRPALLARGRGRLLAGSSIRMLLADPSVDRSVDEAWVAMYLSQGPVFHGMTGYHAITRLLPGEVAGVEGDAWRTRRWFDWRPRRVRESDPAAYAARFRELFDEAVRCRIDGATRVGVSLSGGLDSTSVAMAVSVVRPDLDLVALSIPFDRAPGDERALQRLVAERAGARLRWVPLEGTDPYWAGARDALETFGVPPVPPNRFHVDALADAGAAEGIDVALDGIDGDSVVGGNFYYLSDLAITLRWRRYLRELAAIRAAQGYGRRFVLRDLTVWPLLPAWARLRVRRARGRSHTPNFMAPAFAAAHGIERALELDAWRPGRTYRTDCKFAVSSMIAPLVLETIDEQWSRRGIEVAHPFLDRRLVEFCLGLPREQKTAFGYTKIVLRAAMRGLLPPEVAERADKANLSEAFLSGLRGSGRGEVLQGLELASSNPSRWLAEGSVATLADRFAEGEDLFSAYRVAYMGHWMDWLNEGNPAAKSAAGANGNIAPEG